MIDPDQTLPPLPVTPFAPGWLFGRYRIERKIGEGGMGAVYLAHDTTLERDVALKIPIFSGNKDIAAARFLREARAAAGVQHPNICPIYDTGQLNGTYFLAMQFLAGTPLANRALPLEPKDAARFARSIALAMQAAHAKGVIHRDLKPGNVMIDSRGEPVVMDFGLARRQADRGENLTLQGELMGSPAYMSPEQVNGDVGAMGPGCDIYSLGIVLFEMLTGELPFQGDYFAQISQIVMDPPPLPSKKRPGLDVKFDLVILRALAKNPEERWKSMQAFADVLAPLAGFQVLPAESLASGPGLTLRVAGTRFAYKPPPGLPSISVGRQKRKAGDPPDQGNDFVLRVAGNDALSARISRRHFEIQRTPAGYSIIDRSKTGVLRNGEPLPPGMPVPLADGDLLSVASVLTLEVQIGGKILATNPAAAVEVPAPVASGGGQFNFEASIGDMVTMG